MLNILGINGGKIMKKMIIVFFILALLSLNSVCADENETLKIYAGGPWEGFGADVVQVTYDTPVDSDNNVAVEQTDSVQDNTLQEDTATQNNNSAMKSNAQTQNNTQPISNTQSQNNTQPASNTQSMNNTSNNVSVATPMQNTGNPLIVMLLACILISIGIYRKKINKR